MAAKLLKLPGLAHRLARALLLLDDHVPRRAIQFDKMGDAKGAFAERAASEDGLVQSAGYQAVEVGEDEGVRPCGIGRLGEYHMGQGKTGCGSMVERA